MRAGSWQPPAEDESARGRRGSQARVVADSGAREVPDRRLRNARRLVMAAALLEILLILPWVDRFADGHPTVHFTQHGFIFLGGVLMGIALRDVHHGSRE